MLVDKLPMTSWTKTWLRDNVEVEVDQADRHGPVSFGPWSQTDYLLAAVNDRLDRVGQVVIQMQGDRKTKPPKWEPVARPSQKTRVVNRKNVDAAKAAEAAHNARREAALREEAARG